MTFLPIVMRELLVAARRAVTYRNRFWVPFVGLGISTGILFVMEGRGVAASAQGAAMFFGLASLGMVYALVVGVRVTADCLSVEKRDGTLGLLFLTDLTGLDVVLGKMAATSLNAVYGLIALIPLLAVPLQLGGVTGVAFSQMVLCLMNTLFLSLSIGIFVSSLSYHDRKAMTTAFIVLAGVVGGPFALLIYVETLETSLWMPLRWLVWFLVVVSPISGFIFADSSFSGGGIVAFFDTVGWSPSVVFWVSLILSHGLAWIGLLLSARFVAGVVRKPTLPDWVLKVQQWIHLLVYGDAESRRAHRREYLELNPFSWLTSRERLKGKYVWIFVGAITLIFVWNLYQQGDVMFDDRTLLPLGFLIHAFLKVWIASEACYRIAEDRRIGALELVLSTPLGPWDIVRGQFLALWRQFGLPLLVLVGLELILILGFATEPRDVTEFRNRAIYLGAVAMLLLDALLIPWVAMWYGLRQGSANRAIARTVVIFLMVPWVFYAISLELWESLRLMLTQRGWVRIDLQWMLEDWSVQFEWRPLRTLGSVVMWSVIGAVYGAYVALSRARIKLVIQFRELVASSQGDTSKRS